LSLEYRSPLGNGKVVVNRCPSVTSSFPPPQVRQVQHRQVSSVPSDHLSLSSSAFLSLLLPLALSLSHSIFPLRPSVPRKIIFHHSPLVEFLSSTSRLCPCSAPSQAPRWPSLGLVWLLAHLNLRFPRVYSSQQLLVAFSCIAGK
jgi:hypothetical protein